MPGFVIAIIAISFITMFFVAFPILLYRNNHIKVPRETQWQISDKEILLMMSQQRSGYLSPEQLAKGSGLSKGDAKKRLFALLHKRVITNKYSGMRQFFKLKEEIDGRSGPRLSNNPFITTDDLFLLFAHHNYELTIHKICIDTGLPVNVIYKELERFVKEKVIVKISDRFFNTSYILREPYSSNPEKDVASEDFLDLDLSKIYQKETRSRNS
jgi:hypothetical protein